jgi:hypothetical protein
MSVSHLCRRGVCIPICVHVACFGVACCRRPCPAVPGWPCSTCYRVAGVLQLSDTHVSLNQKHAADSTIVDIALANLQPVLLLKVACLMWTSSVNAACSSMRAAS